MKSQAIRPSKMRVGCLRGTSVLGTSGRVAASAPCGPASGQLHVENAFGSAGALDQIAKQTPQGLGLAVAIAFDEVRLVLVGQAIETLVNGTTAL